MSGGAVDHFFGRDKKHLNQRRCHAFTLLSSRQPPYLRRIPNTCWILLAIHSRCIRRLSPQSSSLSHSFSFKPHRAGPFLGDLAMLTLMGKESLLLRISDITTIITTTPPALALAPELAGPLPPAPEFLHSQSKIRPAPSDLPELVPDTRIPQDMVIGLYHKIGWKDINKRVGKGGKQPCPHFLHW